MTKPIAETVIDKEGVPDATPSSGSMHRPPHSPLDMADIAAQDEVQHESALRNSILRTPR